jgi:protein-S-isoprenylcysteine O-methyltransferase
MPTPHPIYLFLERPLWGTVFALSYVAFFMVGMWAGYRERGMPRGEDRDRGSRVIIYILTFTGIALAFVAPRFFPSARIVLPDELVFVAAMTVFWSGIVMYCWAISTLGAAFRTSVQLLDEQRLVTIGPYRILRHPAYTGGILILAGIGLATGNWLSAAASTLSVAGAYAWRIHVEEFALRERFGEQFKAHERRTWVVIPFLW